VSAPIILAAVRWTLPALCALLLLAGCGGDDKPTTTAVSSKPAGVTCRKVSAPAPKGEQDLAKPKAALPAGKRYDVDLQTNCGTITIRLATGRAPKTSASFANLVRRGFYDGLTFHRVVHDFVIQGGDPLGTGMGGPGYTVVEPPPADLAYTTGIVAMAKTEADPSGASGSQFFIVTAPDAGLPPDYAVAGGVVRGMNVAQHIGTLPVDDQDRPTSPVVIEKATLRTG
jgi:cyclophilin family peptidyl-prolyl cis-trans isomerase